MIIYNHPNKSLAVHESLTTGRCFAHSFPSFSSASTPRCQSCETKIDIKHGVLWTKSGEPSFCRRFCWIPYGRNDVNLYVENRDTVYWTVWSTLFFVQNKAMFQVWHDSQMVLLVQPKPGRCWYIWAKYHMSAPVFILFRLKLKTKVLALACPCYKNWPPSAKP